MLGTLNLQFTPLEFTDESLATSELTPGTEAGAGFADLLRLRVDAGVTDTGIPGDFLPQSGSDLPLRALPVELETPAATGISESLLTLSEPTAESTEPLIEVSIGAISTAETPASALPQATPVAAPVVMAPDLATGTVDRRDILGSAESRPLPVVVTPQPGPQNQDTTLTSLAATNSQAPALTERPLADQMRAVEDRAIPIDLPKRTETSPLPVTSSEEISEVFKARPTVVQPVQVLGSQPNPQQALVMPAPAAPPVTESGYAAAAQQASDLISTPVRDTAWGEQIGERVLLMAGNQTKTAEIRLTPAELGPLRVQVSVDDGAANVTFQAQHAATREAIEQALPRLRELLAENGLSLGQADVGEQGVSEGDREQETGSTRDDSGSSEGLEDGNPEDSATARNTLRSSSLVDTFV